MGARVLVGCAGIGEDNFRVLLPATVGELRSQLRGTQTSLTSHDVKFHHLDTLVNEDNGFKYNIELIKEFMEERKQKAEARDQCHDKEFSTDDDDTRSIATRVGKDEKATAKHEDHRRSSLEATQTKVDDRHNVHQVAIEEAIESWKKGVEGNCRRSKDTGMWRRIVCVTLCLERNERGPSEKPK
ncbi:hypothetical protein BJ322DRAFT_1022548 [Thelephora terrestris]|uniref:Uncharacterized protein n=1 Tax=Thelephora terrestris TaxID=56493 RepID=A0A9P6HAX5_9AGAM|nr:hypothetical protein BJ322DRAFT_1022548 [Thelephora terrestris]